MRPDAEAPLAQLPTRVIQWSMDALYGALFATLPLYAAVRATFDQKTRSRWAAYLRDVPERFGRRHRRASKGPCVWVHGVSVGEVKAAATLVEVIEDCVPGVEVIVSVTTDTGHRVARDRYPGRRIEFYPPDLSWIVDDALDALRPDLMVLVESEFWPNFLVAARERGIPVALVNGRMSARSAGRFRFMQSLAVPLLGSLEKICVQTPLYQERFESVGIDPARIHVTGNMKLDNIPLEPDSERQIDLAALFGVSSDLPTIVVGSSHPSEEKTLARIVKRLRDKGREFRVIIAPRHPGRAETVSQEIASVGIRVARRSRLTPDHVPSPSEVIVLDTVGELELVYGLADVVFVGGTLIPHGGQNVMEPASLGKPVIVGPHVHNFRGEVDMLREAGGLIVASSAAEVEATLDHWLANPAEAEAAGERAREVIDGSKGATDRTLEILMPLLERLAPATELAR